jgi:hypothetical protein
MKHSKDENKVVALKEMFDAAISDVEWITELSQDKDNEWVVITCDARIRRNQHEEMVWRDAGLPTYFLTKAGGI